MAESLRWSHTEGRWLADGEVCDCDWCVEILDLPSVPEGWTPSMEWFDA